MGSFLIRQGIFDGVDPVSPRIALGIERFAADGDFGKKVGMAFAARLRPSQLLADDLCSRIRSSRLRSRARIFLLRPTSASYYNAAKHPVTGFLLTALNHKKPKVIFEFLEALLCETHYHTVDSFVKPRKIPPQNRGSGLL